MRLPSPAWILVWSVQTSLAIMPSHAQTASDIELRVPAIAASPLPGNLAQRKFVAGNDLVTGFNAIGSHAAALRRAMKREDADAFDAVMLDVMSALIALPDLRLVHSGDANRITPRMPRYDRVPQIGPDLLALERFFSRLRQASSSVADARLFTNAQKSARRMLSALPFVLATVSSKNPAFAKMENRPARH